MTFSRTLETVIATWSTYIIGGLLTFGSNMISGVPLVLAYTGVALGSAKIFARKTWIPIASGGVGLIALVIGRLDNLNVFNVLLNAGLFGTSYIVARKKISGSSGKSSNRSTRPKGSVSKPQNLVQNPSRVSPQTNIDLPTRGILVLGNAGSGLSSSRGKFGDAKVNAGILGEQETVSLLIAAFRNSQYPVVLVNSIEFAGSKNADVDHAIIAGRYVFLIDSKKYREGNYMATSSNMVITQGKNGKMGYRKIHMDSALENYRKMIPMARFPKAYVIIHSSGNVVGNQMGGVMFGTPQQVVSDIRSQVMSIASKTIDKSIVDIINARRK